MGAGLLEGALATVTGVAMMPLLLWIGMRMLRERGNHLLVVIGAVVWVFLGGHVVEGSVNSVATVCYLALFAAVCGVLAALQARPD